MHFSLRSLSVAVAMEEMNLEFSSAKTDSMGAAGSWKDGTVRTAGL